MPEVKRVMAEQGLVVPDPTEMDTLPPLTPELTGQIGELYRAGWTGESIIVALRTGDMTKLVQRPNVQPVTLATSEGGAPAEEGVPEELGAGFGG